MFYVPKDTSWTSGISGETASASWLTPRPASALAPATDATTGRRWVTDAEGGIDIRLCKGTAPSGLARRAREGGSPVDRNLRRPPAFRLRQSQAACPRNCRLVPRDRHSTQFRARAFVLRLRMGTHRVAAGQHRL